MINLPEFYVDGDYIYTKDGCSFELIYQNEAISILIKHPVILSGDESKLDIRVTETNLFDTQYIKTIDTSSSVNFKHKKIIIEKTLKTLESLNEIR